MTSIVPELDDVEFDELVDEGRDLIPRFAPSWTDHNLHDPGITLIDLIAFLVDQQIYRIGFVGDSLLGAFTRLLGVMPREPEAARLLVWPLAEMQALDLPMGTPIESKDVPDARYTVDAHVMLVSNTIEEIWEVVGSDTKALGTGLTEGRDALDLLPFSGGGPRALQFKLNQHIAPIKKAGFVSLGVTLSGAAEGVSRWDSVQVEQKDQGGFWRSLETVDRTKGFRFTETILFKPIVEQPDDSGEFRIRLDQGFRPGSITLNRFALNVLNVGGVKTVWSKVDELQNSGPADAHYRLTEKGIQFGNSINGMTVPCGVRIRRGAVRRTLGASGGVAAQMIWRVAGQDIGINVEPSSEGRDRDRFEDLVRQSRERAKKRNAKLKSIDIEKILLTAGLGLENVEVISQRRPGLDGIVVPGHRTILVVPGRDPHSPPKPMSNALYTAVQNVLAPARLLGERLHISTPVYFYINVDIELVLTIDTVSAQATTKAESLIRQRLWDVQRLPDQHIKPWPAGRSVTVGEIRDLLAGLPEVVRVSECRIGIGDTLSHEPIVLKDREICLADRVAIRVLHAVQGGGP